MARRQYYLIIDTETTQDSLVADFGAIVCDRKGRIYNQCAVLIRDIFNNRERHPLFYTKDADPLWGASTLNARYARYNEMLDSGTRMLASVNAVNRWLEKASGKYDPVLTAYNLAFDIDKMRKTSIDVSMFSQSFCLWHAAANKWAQTRKFQQFILDNGEFNQHTKFGNWSYRTKAETMARFLLGSELPNEPHTALEDARDYEMPILQELARTTPRKVFMNPPPFNWRKVQVKEHYRPK